MVADSKGAGLFASGNVANDMVMPNTGDARFKSAFGGIKIAVSMIELGQTL